MSAETFTFVSTISGAIVGGVIGYFSSLWQTRAIERKELAREILRRKEQMVTAIYELSDYVHKYTITTQFSSEQIGQTGPNPIKQVLALSTLYFPDMKTSVLALENAINDMHSKLPPVSNVTMQRAIDACNEFGETFSKRYIKAV